MPHQNLVVLGSRPVDINCPECHDDVRTVIVYYDRGLEQPPKCYQSLLALILCCLCWPCLCIPVCCVLCFSGIHECPNCNAEVGTQGPSARSRRSQEQGESERRRP